MKITLDIELAHDREHAIRIDLITLQGCTSLPTRCKDHALTQPITLGKGVLVSTFSDKFQSLNITPNLRGELPRSTGDTPKPLYKALWPRI
jgi:hypothetical protein